MALYLTLSDEELSRLDGASVIPVSCLSLSKFEFESMSPVEVMREIERGRGEIEIYEVHKNVETQRTTFRIKSWSCKYGYRQED